MADLIYFLLIGLAASWLAGLIMRHSFGIDDDLVVDVIGASWVDSCSSSLDF